MVGMGLSFGVAGVLQAYIERILGLGFMTAQAQMRFWFAVTWVFGLFLFAGVVLAVVDLLTVRSTPAAQERA
jgi:nitric oxide reductase subunit B